MKKSVLIIAHLQNHIRNFHFEYIKHLQELGYEVSVATKVDNINELNFIDHVFDIDFKRSPFNIATFKNYKTLVGLMRTHHFDIVHTHTPVASIIARFAAHKCKVNKVFYTAHGFHFFNGAPLINWLIYFPAEFICSYLTDVLFTMNSEDFKRAKKWFKHPNVVYTPGVGINLDNYHIHHELHDDIRLIMVAELIKNKHQYEAIKAINQLNNPNLHLYLAGYGQDQQRLQELVTGLHLENQVYFLGFVKPVVKAFDNKDLFIFPSEREGLSVALMEAMACGLPCVVSKIRGNTDLIDVNGGVFIGSDVDSIASGIKQMLAKKDQWEAMGKYNQEKVKPFGYENVFKILDQYYH